MFMPSGVMHHCMRLRMSHSSVWLGAPGRKVAGQTRRHVGEEAAAQELVGALASAVWQSAHAWLRSPTRR